MTTVELLGNVPLWVMDLEATCDEGDGLRTSDMKAFFGRPSLPSSSPKLYLAVLPVRAAYSYSGLVGRPNRMPLTALSFCKNC